MNELGVAPSRPQCHVFATCLCLYTRPNPQATVYSVVLCPCPCDPLQAAMAQSLSPQGSGVGTGLLCLFLLPLVWSTQGFVHSARVCFLDLSQVEYISLSNSLSPFSLFWGLSEKVWRSKPFTGNCFLVAAGVDAEGFYSPSLGSSLCFEREKWVAISLGVWALLSICGFGIPFPRRFFVLLQNAFCVKALPLD